MKCRQCGTEIADKALICYRCGTATTEAKYKPAVITGGRTGMTRLFQLAIVLLLLLLVWEGAAWAGMADQWPEIRRVAIAVVAVIAAAAGVLRRR